MSSSEVPLRHIFLIDPLEKLVIKKDSSLLMAHTAQQLGNECYILLKEDLFFSNVGQCVLKLYKFKSQLSDNSFYLQNFTLELSEMVPLLSGDTIHMRLDPPFNLEYLHTLWVLKAFVQQGIIIRNSPLGIAAFNEKLTAYCRDDQIPTWVGISSKEGESFIRQLLSGKDSKDFIIKPLDLFQGIGVEKITFNAKDGSTHIKNILGKKVDEFGGAIVIQSFVPEVCEGEIRSIFFQGRELGSIVKIPPQGEFLANIAQGASFEAFDLPNDMAQKCQEVAKELLEYGIDFIAFDILGGAISVINITCPGLLVEFSNACNDNLAEKMFN
jgi:glutathione synthase